MAKQPKQKGDDGKLKEKREVKRPKKSSKAYPTKIAVNQVDQLVNSNLAELATLLRFSPDEVTNLTKSFRSADRLMRNDSKQLTESLGISNTKARSLQVALVWCKFGVSPSLAAALGMRRLDLIRVRDISAEELEKELDASQLPIAPSEKRLNNLNIIIDAARLALPELTYQQALSDLELSDQIKQILKSEKVVSFGDILKLPKNTLRKIRKGGGVDDNKRGARLIGYANFSDGLHSPELLYPLIPVNFVAEMRQDLDRIEKLRQIATVEKKTKRQTFQTIERLGKDKLRQATPQVLPIGHPPGVLISSLPDWWKRRFTPRRTTQSIKMATQTDLQSQVAKSLHKFKRAGKKFNWRRIPQDRLEALAINAALNQRKFLDLTTRPAFLTQENIQELLRVFMFDQPIELRQTFWNEGLEYNLNNPSRGHPPNTYSGYVIVADEIHLTTDINTNGHDLVLVSPKIIGPTAGAIEIRTEPAPMNKRDYPFEGNHADNGGDVVFVTKEFQNMANVNVIASGGRGQDGSDGRDMHQPVTVTIEKEEEELIDGISIGGWQHNGILFGTAIDVNLHSGFQDGSCWIKDPFNETKFTTPPNGIYGIIAIVRNAAWRTNVWIRIDPQFYPSEGKPGGYGGYPGKVTLVLPFLPASAPIMVAAETGADGLPGKGGSGGELTPKSVYLSDGSIEPLPIQDYINQKTRNKIRETRRRVVNDDGSVSDQFTRIETLPQNNALERSAARISFEGSIRVHYYPSLASKSAGDESKLRKRTSIKLILNNIKLYSRCILGTNQYIEFGNIIPYSPTQTPQWPNTLSIDLNKAPDGEPLEPRNTFSESLQTIQSNWYQEVYTLIPEYPAELAKRADRLFRSGNFDAALPLYQEMIAFSEESGFDAPELVSDAIYRIGFGLAGLDYFGFDVNTIIPMSPSREIDLITYYSAAVRFFDESIRDALASQFNVSQLITLLEQFNLNRERLIEQINYQIEMSQLEIAALTLEIDAMRHEIDAIFRANIRMCNILASWWQRVDDRILEIERELEDQMPEERPVWKQALIFYWNWIKLIVAIIAAIYSYGAASSKAAEAWDELGKAAEEGNRILAFVDEFNDVLDTLNEGGFFERLENMQEAFKEFDKAYSKFFELVEQTVDLISEAIEKTKDIKAKLEALTTTSDQWTQQEAIDFRNNVLLADQIDISGAMTYLQIEEQITLNKDLLIGKQLALQAAVTRRRGLTAQVFSLTRQLARHVLDQLAVQQSIEDYQVGLTSNAAIISQLNSMGQTILDSMMRRLQEHAFQMRFLNLDNAPLQGRYDRFINSAVDVGIILQRELDIREQFANWTAANSNIGRIKIIIKRSEPIDVGTLTQIAPELLDNFSRGEFVRPSEIFRLEPLRETEFVQSLGTAIASRLTNIGELAYYLAQQFSSDYDVVGEHKANVDRERLFHPILDQSTVGSLDDEEVVLAYALALGGVTTPLLNNLLLMVSLPTLLEARLQKLNVIWDYLSPEILDEDVRSIRVMSETIQAQTMTASQIANLLIDNLIDGNSVIALSDLHLQEEDIQLEIESSYDPDFPNSQGLGSIHNGDDFNVVLAIILLYGGIDETQLQDIVDQFPNEHMIGDRLKNMQVSWNELRRSVLERQHALIIHIGQSDVLALPNNANTSLHRVLTVRSVVKAGSASLNYSLIVRKIPLDVFLQDAELVEMTFLTAEQLSFPQNIETPTGLNIDDYHNNQLFGRGLMGEWEIVLTNKGNQPALPVIDELEVEFIYTFQGMT